MKFKIEFSGNNLLKFRSFIRMCNKIFTKTGIVMTIVKNEHIRVAADPFNITDKFEHNNCTSETLEIYKNFIFVEYTLIPSTNNSQKNSTYNTIELKMSNKNKNSNDNFPINEILTFRITRDQLNKLNDLLHTDFLSADQLTLKATNLPDFMKKKLETQNISYCYLSIFDKPVNSTKSGILFIPLKKFFEIRDNEDDMDDSENKVLGNFLFSEIIKTKILRKFASLASKTSNKMITLYLYKENDLKENNTKSYLYFSYLANSINLGKYIQNEENISNSEEFDNIYKLQINSEILLKVLKNFGNDINNPDFISVWTNGLVFKTHFTLRYEEDNNQENNFFENEEGNDNYDNENNEETLSYMAIKAFTYTEKNVEILKFENLNSNDGIEKRKYILNLIDNNIDDKHDELNKSLDLSDIEDAEIFRNNNIMEEEEDENEDMDDEIEQNNNKGKKNKNKNKNKDVSEDNDESSISMANNKRKSESKNNITAKITGAKKRKSGKKK